MAARASQGASRRASVAQTRASQPNASRHTNRRIRRRVVAEGVGASGTGRFASRDRSSDPEDRVLPFMSATGISSSPYPNPTQRSLPPKLPTVPQDAIAIHQKQQVANSARQQRSAGLLLPTKRTVVNAYESSSHYLHFPFICHDMTHKRCVLSHIRCTGDVRFMILGNIYCEFDPTPLFLDDCQTSPASLAVTAVMQQNDARI